MMDPQEKLAVQAVIIAGGLALTNPELGDLFLALDDAGTDPAKLTEELAPIVEHLLYAAMYQSTDRLEPDIRSQLGDINSELAGLAGLTSSNAMNQDIGTAISSTGTETKIDVDALRLQMIEAVRADCGLEHLKTGDELLESLDGQGAAPLAPPPPPVPGEP